MTPENPGSTLPISPGPAMALPPGLFHPDNRKRTIAIIGGIIVLFGAIFYFGKTYFGNFSSANHYVEPYTLVDANLSIRPSFLNGVVWSLNGTNLGNKKHREFTQGNLIGRLIMTRIQVTF